MSVRPARLLDRIEHDMAAFLEVGAAPIATDEFEAIAWRYEVLAEMRDAMEAF
jgi:hypothetical protein